MFVTAFPGGAPFTTNDFETDLVQLPLVTVYVIVCVPGPAIPGLKVFPLTPGPLKTPPLGEKPLRVKFGPFSQNTVWEGLKLTDPMLKTRTVKLKVSTITPPLYTSAFDG